MHAIHFSGGVIPDFGQSESIGGEMPLRPTAPITEVRVSRDILHGSFGDAQPETQAEPMIASDPMRPDQLVAAYQDNRFSTGGARALVRARSVDGGLTWREARVPGLTTASGGPFERASDPWVAFGSNNDVYVSAIAFNETSPDNGVFVNVSHDGGRTFGDPVAVHTNAASFDDKETVAVDNYPESPFRGNVYVGWDIALDNNQTIMNIARSRDGGETYGAPVVLENSGAGNIGIIPLVAPNGTVYALWTRFHTTGLPDLMFSRSNDGGATWTRARSVMRLHLRGIQGIRSGSEIVSAAIDRTNGAIYVVWADGRFTPRAQIALTSSSNRGNTWSPPKRVSVGINSTAHFTPAVAVNSAGTVEVAFYSLPEDPTGKLSVMEEIATSSNRGKHSVSRGSV